MKNLSFILTLFMIIMALTFNSCKKDLSSVNPNITEFHGSVLVDVRSLLGVEKWMVFSGNRKHIPRTPVVVDLKVLDELSDSLITIQTHVTDDAGYTSFDSLKENTYYIFPRVSEEIGSVWIDSLLINRHNQNDTVHVGVSYYWAWSTNDFNYIFEIDSSDTSGYNLHLRWFYNIGIRDTLYCSFDTTAIPSWFSFYINSAVYPPVFPKVSGNWMSIFYKISDIPIESLPFTIEVPMTFQYGKENLIFTFNIKEPDSTNHSKEIIAPIHMMEQNLNNVELLLENAWQLYNNGKIFKTQ